MEASVVDKVYHARSLARSAEEWEDPREDHSEVREGMCGTVMADKERADTTKLPGKDVTVNEGNAGVSAPRECSEEKREP